MLIVFPTVVFGGVERADTARARPQYADNALRQDLWRAGHAHGGVLLLLTLVVLRYVDETGLSEGIRWYVRLAVPVAAVLLPIASPVRALPGCHPTDPLVYLAYVGAALLVTGLLILGIGLLRTGPQSMAAVSDGPSRLKVVSTQTQIRSRSGSCVHNNRAPCPPALGNRRAGNRRQFHRRVLESGLSLSSPPPLEPWQWAPSRSVPWRAAEDRRCRCTPAAHR